VCSNERAAEVGAEGVKPADSSRTLVTNVLVTAAGTRLDARGAADAVQGGAGVRGFNGSMEGGPYVLKGLLPPFLEGLLEVRAAIEAPG
jgi:hypothetical protein